MKILKGIATYTAILVLIAFALAIIACGYLFLFPTQSLFGIQYISSNTSFAEGENQLDGVDTIIVNGGNIDIYVNPAGSTSSLEGHFYARYSGFGFAEKAVSSLVFEKNENVITINVSEPSGLLSTNSCFLKIFIPNLINDNLNLTINTNKAKSYIGINVETGIKLNFNNLTLNSHKGQFVLYNIVVGGNLVCDIGDGTITASQLFTGSVESFNLTTNKGVANFGNVSSELILSDVVWKNNSVGRLYLKNVQNLEVSGNGGLLSVDSVDYLSISARSVKVAVNTINNSSSIYLSQEGSVNIGQANDYLEIETNKANINITSTLAAVTVNTQQGKVNIKNAVQIVSVLTQSGDIFVQFDKTAAAGESVRKALLLSNSGKIVVKNVDVLVAKANNKGKVHIDATFNEIIENSQNIIQSGGGNVKIVIASENILPFIIDYSAEGSIDIYVEDTKKTAKGNFSLYPNGATSTTATKISIVTGGGNLYMRSSDLVDID